jgi:putative ABC transport system permease protein
MLLAGAGLMLRTVWSLLRTDLGFDPRNLLTFQLALPWTYDDEQKTVFHREVLARLEALPGVDAAAFDNDLPLARVGQAERALIQEERQSEDERLKNPYVNVHRVSPGYFDAMRIPILDGRALEDFDRENGERVAVVSESLAEWLWPNESALGKRWKRVLEGQESPWLRVVGVASNVRHDAVDAESGYDAYLSSWQFVDGWNHVVLRTTVEPMTLSEDVLRTIWSVDPDQAVFNFQSMESLAAATVWQKRVAALLFGAFGILAVALAASGIYGVVSHRVSARTREIGLRMALGAERREVYREVLGGALRLTLLGIAIGLAAALGLGRFVAHLLHGVSAFDPATLAGASFFLALTALAASFAPARRAASVDPVIALRHE